MAKRNRTAAPKTARKPAKKATPSNPKPQEPSVVNVNPDYDEMPDTIEDPAAVYRMAMLDMKRVAVNNKLAVVAMEQERKVAAAVRARDNELKEVKAELRDAERQFIEQKQSIEKTYGIALRAYTYNDETGTLTKQALPDEEPEEVAGAVSEEGSGTLH